MIFSGGEGDEFCESLVRYSIWDSRVLMGRVFLVELEGRSYRCRFCNNNIALADDVLSRVISLFTSSLLFSIPILPYMLQFWLLMNWISQQFERKREFIYPSNYIGLRQAGLIFLVLALCFFFPLSLSLSIMVSWINWYFVRICFQFCRLCQVLLI